MSLYLHEFGRTVFGKRNGKLRGFTAKELLLSLCDQRISPKRREGITNLIVCNTRSAGLGPVFPVQIAHRLRLREVEATGISLGCISGLQGIIDALRLSQCHLYGSRHRNVLVTATESFSRAPILQMKLEMTSDKFKLVDHNVADGFECKVTGTVPLQQVVNFLSEFPATRQELDTYAVQSHKKASMAWDSGKLFSHVVSHGGLDRDECVRFHPTLDAFSRAPGVYEQNHVAVSNVTSPCDGAAFVFASSEASPYLVQDFAFGYCDPHVTFQSALPAIKLLLHKNNLKVDDIDVWEISDPFALVGKFYAEKLQMDPSKVNQLGGTLAYGHPSGVTSLRCLLDALVSLRAKPNSKYAVVSSPGQTGVGCAVLIRYIA